MSAFGLKGLRGDTALYALAVGLDRLLAFLMLPFLTRLIAPQDFGAWTQTAVSAGLLVPLVLFAFPTAIVRSFSGGGGECRTFFDRLGGIAAGLYLVAVGAVLAAGGAVAGWVYGDATARALLPALLLWVAADAAIEFGVAWLRAAGRMGRVAGVLIGRSLVRYGTLLLLVGGGEPPLAVWLMHFALLQAGYGVLVVLLSRAQLGPPAAGQPHAAELRELLRFALPLVALAGFTSLNAVLDRYLLLRTLDLGGLAVYAAAQSLANIPTLFHTVLGFTLFPVLARHWRSGKVDQASGLVARSLQAYLFLCVPVALLITLAGPWGLPRLTTAHYGAPLSLFAALGVSVVAFGVYQILLYALLLDGRSGQVLGLAVLATALNAGLNLLLAPRFGATGAAAAVASANLLMSALAARLAHAVLPWRFPWAGVARIGAGSLLAALPLAWAAAQEQPSAMLMLGAALLAAALYLGLDLARPGSIARSILP
ncbi:MAG: lipopolysaccharide biosynthesis protein [Piscinibacter sp.]|uniref:lipopolysaccharide biosynthesis protein n=1 Tax=Piscinibacter sp. TaxID=1903157 RepID=UPI00258AC2C1|nr:lipopolysaccharide biosynthesis protein [Piscinibacter sp.]MCW5666930.1 lipopolysaccharide biosynthesis protein [Piscinibacter sp.]